MRLSSDTLIKVSEAGSKWFTFRDFFFIIERAGLRMKDTVINTLYSSRIEELLIFCPFVQTGTVYGI